MSSINPALLKERAVSFEEIDVRHDYEQTELDTLRELFTDLSLKRADKEEEFGEVRKAFKADITVLRDSIKGLATDIRNRFKDTKSSCALIPNFENGMMEYYEENTGQLVHSRRLRPEERQENIHNVIHSNSLSSAKAA